MSSLGVEVEHCTRSHVGDSAHHRVFLRQSWSTVDCYISANRLSMAPWDEFQRICVRLVAILLFAVISHTGEVMLIPTMRICRPFPAFRIMESQSPSQLSVMYTVTQIVGDNSRRLRRRQPRAIVSVRVGRLWRAFSFTVLSATLVYTGGGWEGSHPHGLPSGFGVR